MCNFKSGIIFKNRVVLAPMWNDSHSKLLESLHIEDTTVNASKMFVRAELIPPKDIQTLDVSKWIFKVDQDIVPDWYEKDPGRYEEEFRKEVEGWMKGKFQVICGQLCVKFKEDENGTYYKTVSKLFESEFGETNDYSSSYVREKLDSCEFAKKLKQEYSDMLVPVTLSLCSLDGFDDYGVVNGDILSLMNIDLYRECRKNIPNPNGWEWLATPDSTLSGYGSGLVQYVYSGGDMCCLWCGGVGAVRPFFILKSEA